MSPEVVTQCAETLTCQQQASARVRVGIRVTVRVGGGGGAVQGVPGSGDPVRGNSYMPTARVSDRVGVRVTQCVI